MHNQKNDERSYRVKFRHRIRHGVKSVFLSIKPKWGPFRTFEMVRESNSVYSYEAEVTETERYNFHEVPSKHRSAFYRHMIGYSLRDQMLKKNPITFKNTYPFVETISGERYVRVETIPELFSAASLRLFKGQSHKDLKIPIAEFAEWKIPVSQEVEVETFRLVFENDRQRILWPEENLPALSWPDDKDSTASEVEQPGTVLQLDPDENYGKWLKTLEVFGTSFDSVMLPPFFYADPGKRYQVRDYRQFSDDLGTLDDLELVFEWLRNHGKRLIIDLPFRFCSSQHPWALDPSSEMIERYPNGEHSHWAMNPDCLLLNWSNGELVDELVSLMQELQKTTGAWGFRIDCAHEIPLDVYRDFLTRAKRGGVENIFGEAWDYTLPTVRATNYLWPNFMHQHAQGWDSMNVLDRYLRKYLFEIGLTFPAQSLNYFSSHDTKFLDLPQGLYEAYFFISLFLPGPFVYYAQDLKEILSDLDHGRLMGIAREFAHCPIRVGTLADGFVLERGTARLLFSNAKPLSTNGYQRNFSEHFWFSLEVA